MSQKLAEYDPRLVGGGLAPSMKNLTSKLWEDGSNVTFDHDGVRPLPGQDLLFVKLEASPVIGMHEAEVAGTKTLFYGTPAALYRYEDGGTVADFTRAVGGAYNGIEDATATQMATRWTFADWGDVIYAANGIDNIQRFRDGVDPKFIDWNPTNSPASALIIGRIKDFLIAYGTDSNARAVQWASGNAPDTWGAAVNNSAGTLPIRDLDTDIRCVVEIGEGEVAIYGLNQAFRFSFVGSPAFFAANHALTGIGAVSPHSVVSANGFHFGFGPRGIWQSDLSSYDYIDVPEIREYIYEENILRDQISKAVAIHDSGQNMVLFYWPGDATGEITRVTYGVGYNYDLNNWTILDAPRTASTRGAVFDYLLTGDVTGNVWKTSVEGFAPSSDQPMPLPAVYELKAGYGMLGYGSLGYGGIESGEG